MLIRSQNKKYLVSTNNITFYVMDSEVICFGISGIEDSDYIILGHYETESKAIKVLDMIQEAYAYAKLNEILLPDVCKSASESQRGKDNTLIAKTIRKDFMKKMIFQMPEDSEVVV